MTDLSPQDIAEIVARYQPLDWHEVWATTSIEPSWVVPDMIEHGRIHVLYSAAGLGKSLLVDDLCGALVTFGPLLGRENPNEGPQRVLYVDHENAQADLHARFHSMGYDPDDLAPRLIYLSFPDMPSLDTAAGGAHLLALAKHHRPNLIVIDTVSRVIDGEENASDTFRALYRHTMAPLKSAGFTLLRLDHEGKDGSAGQRGSKAKDDDADAVWRLAAATGEPGREKPDGSRDLRLLRGKQRTGHLPQEIKLQRLANPTRHIRCGDDEARSDVDRIVQVLDRAGVDDLAGAPTCRAALTREKEPASSANIAAAVKARKARLRAA